MTLCGIERCRPNYKFQTSNRPGYHLHVILEGRGKLCVNGKTNDLHFGQMFITKPNEPVWYQADNDDPWVYCWMTFDGSLARQCAEDAGFYSGINVLDCHIDQHKFYSLVAQVLEEADLTTTGVYSRTGILLEYIGAAVDSNFKNEGNGNHAAEYQTDDYVNYAVDLIKENYTTIKIADVANCIGLHRCYLSNIFKQEMGISPQKYLMQCRVQEACRLLEETSIPIQEISRQVGYDNPLTFSKTFKNFYGISPKNYRLKVKAKKTNT